MISNDLNHKTEAVACFQTKLITYLKDKHPNVEQIHYFSDGSGEQFKNCKNFANIIRHEQDYGLKCKWNFFATAHGKGAVDGVGAGINP